jgi:hypothetical protein
MPSSSSELGDALRPDGTLKDASEINWSFDADDSLPFPEDLGDPTGGSSDMPAPGEAGLRRTTRVSRPSRRYIEDLDSDCAPSTVAHNQPATKRKALSDNPDSNRRVARKVVIDSDGDSDEDVPSVPPTEIAEDDYESIKAMADADNQVCLPSCSLSYSSHLHHRLRFSNPKKSVRLMYASFSAATRSISILQREKPWMAIGARFVGKYF